MIWIIALFGTYCPGQMSMNLFQSLLKIWMKKGVREVEKTSWKALSILSLRSASSLLDSLKDTTSKWLLNSTSTFYKLLPFLWTWSSRRLRYIAHTQNQPLRSRQPLGKSPLSPYTCELKPVLIPIKSPPCSRHSVGGVYNIDRCMSIYNRTVILPRCV